MALYTYKYNDLKTGSFNRLESTINNHVIPNLGYLQLHAIRQDDIQLLINRLMTSGLSYSSIKKIYEAINACFKHALIKEDVLKNSVAGVKLPSQSRFPKKEITIFTESQMEQFYQELSRKYRNGNPVYLYPDAFVLILNTGLRIGEALALQWEDVNLEDKSIHIRRNVIKVKTRDPKDITKHTGYINIIQDSTKTYAGDRVIHLNKKAFAAISTLHEANRQHTFVICNSLGKPVPTQKFERTFHRVLDNCNIDKCGVHTLRHTFASMLFRKGADVKAVSKILGHAKVSVTYGTYIHLIKEQRKETIELLDDEE